MNKETEKNLHQILITETNMEDKGTSIQIKPQNVSRKSRVQNYKIETNRFKNTDTTQMHDGTRIQKWDLLRALLIFLVVLGHLTDLYTPASKNMQALFLFIYSFHMPCFLFLDGLLGKRNIQERRYNRIFSYIIMYLFAKILYSIVGGLVNHSISFSLFSEGAFPWYGLCLFWCSLLTIFLSKFPSKWVLVFSVILACMVGYDNNIGDMLVLSRTIVFYPFYFIGYCLDPEQIAKKLSFPVIRVIGLLFLSALAGICLFQTESVYFFRALLTGRNSYSVLSSTYGMDNLVVFGGLLRLFYYAVACAGCISIISLIPNHLSHSKAVQAVGKRSLEIYILHRPAIYILYNGFSFASRVATWGNIGGWIIIPLAIVITIVFALPFWEKPIHAIIYPSVLNQNTETLNFT